VGAGAGAALGVGVAGAVETASGTAAAGAVEGFTTGAAVSAHTLVPALKKTPKAKIIGTRKSGFCFLCMISLHSALRIRIALFLPSKEPLYYDVRHIEHEMLNQDRCDDHHS
jgi:hypothetical protein